MIEFSTDDYPPDQRFDAFQEFNLRIAKTDTIRLDDPAARPFHGSASRTPLGHISFSKLAGTPTRYWCLPGSESFRPDYLRLIVNRTGSAIISQFDSDAAFTQVGATIFDNQPRPPSPKIITAMPASMKVPSVTPRRANFR